MFMINRKLFHLFFVLIILFANILEPFEKLNQTKMTMENYSTSDDEITTHLSLSYNLSYRTYFPENYDERNTKLPIVFFLHGVGERGENLDLVETHGIPKLIKNGKKFPFITVAPQCPFNQWWSRSEMIKSLINLVEKVVQKYDVDDSRVYITGLSMGGFGTIALANERPDLFAAALPVCGGADFSDYSNLKRLPIWFFHGSEDDEHPASYSEKIYNALKDQNKDVKLTIYDGVGHNSWDLTYDNQEIYDWLLSKENSGENDKH